MALKYRRYDSPFNPNVFTNAYAHLGQFKKHFFKHSFLSGLFSFYFHCLHSLGDLKVRAVAVVLLSLKICDVTEYKQKSVEQQQRLSLRDRLKVETPSQFFQYINTILSKHLDISFNEFHRKPDT